MNPYRSADEYPATFLLPLRGKSKIHKKLWRKYFVHLVYSARIVFFDQVGKRYKEFYYKDPLIAITKMIAMGDWGVTPSQVMYEEYSQRHRMWVPVQCDELKEMML